MSRNPIYIRLINTARWRQLRANQLRSQPLCERCLELDKSTLATEVHHITPVESVALERAMEQLMFDSHNLQSLCHQCHKDIHTQMRSKSKEAIKANNERAPQRFID